MGGCTVDRGRRRDGEPCAIASSTRAQTRKIAIPSAAPATTSTKSVPRDRACQDYGSRVEAEQRGGGVQSLRPEPACERQGKGDMKAREGGELIGVNEHDAIRDTCDSQSIGCHPGWFRGHEEEQAERYEICGQEHGQVRRYFIPVEDEHVDRHQRGHDEPRLIGSDPEPVEGVDVSGEEYGLEALTRRGA